MKTKLGLIGLGKLGSCLAKGLEHSKDFELRVYDHDHTKLAVFRCSAANSLEELVRQQDFLILCVKPQQIFALLQQLKLFLEPQTCLISVLAGVRSQQIMDCGIANPVVRAMPNVGASVGASITAIASDSKITRDSWGVVEKIFSVIGESVAIEERLFDAFTAVCASGPAFVFDFILALKSAAEAQGIPDSLSEEISWKMIRSAIALLHNTEKNAQQWRAQIATPEGCTEAGLKSLQNDQFHRIIENCILRATTRSQELSLAIDRKPS